MNSSRLKPRLRTEGYIPPYLPRAIEKGRKEYEASRTGSPQSRVHADSDIYAQAMVIGITSQNPIEAQAQAFYTYGAHWIDDFFDSPNSSLSFKEMVKYRTDIQKLFEQNPELNKMCQGMIKKSQRPEGFWKGMTRMLYGGLIQRSRNRKEQDQFLREYKQLGMQNVASEVVQDIEEVRDIPFWMTNKVIFEFIESPFTDTNETLGELWNLAYSPALYLHDADEEEKQGELNFNGRSNPKVSEMIQMIDIATKHISKYENRPSERLRQLRFLRGAFEKVLPREISQAYDRLEQELEKIQPKKPFQGLESKVLSVFGILSISLSTIFFFPNITGNVIANTPQSISNIFGTVLFVLGIFFLFSSSRKKMSYYK
jgi:hypothetical protein